MAASIASKGNMEQVSENKPVTEDTSVEPVVETETEVNDVDAINDKGAEGDAAPSSDSERETSPILQEKLADDEPVLPVTSSQGKKDAAKARRREDKAIEAVLKALSSLSSTEEKLAALCKKYADLLEENKVLQHKFKQGQKSLSVIMKEKDQLQSEHSKAILAKSKLESLCRELQRHNKLIKEESVARAKEEEEKRKEVTSKFQTTINDIQSQMNEHYQKNTKLREENVELANKLKNLIEQYELREQHIEKLFKHKELEQQLADAKFAQLNLQLSEQKEQHLQEKTGLVSEAQQYVAKITILEEQEKHLRAQVAMYTEKYEEFQSTLAKSNDVFQSFKSEMDKMTKKIKKLEKETTMWRSRWENSNRALLEMAEEKTRSDKEIASLNNKQSKLESLCRALQEERRKNNTPNGVVSSEQSSKSEPTKTPPNTPTNQSSRASPETVQQTTEGASTNKTPAPEDQPATNPDGGPVTTASNPETSEAANNSNTSVAVQQASVNETKNSGEALSNSNESPNEINGDQPAEVTEQEDGADDRKSNDDEQEQPSDNHSETSEQQQVEENN